MGRPSSLTPEVASACIAALKRGADRAQAAEAAGVSRRSLERWITAGAALPPPRAGAAPGPLRDLAAAAAANLDANLRQRRRAAARARHGRNRQSPAGHVGCLAYECRNSAPRGSLDGLCAECLGRRRRLYGA